jgi:hypothetical protein
VMCTLDSSAEVTYGSPAACASVRARRQSFHTTRAHPNALANAVRWEASGYTR